VYATPDCQAATPLQVGVAVVVALAVVVVVFVGAVLLDLAVVLADGLEVVNDVGCAVDPSQALIGLQPLLLVALGTALVQ